MFAQVDVPAYDFIDSDDEPRFKLFEFDSEEFPLRGLKVIIGQTVVTFYPVDDLARAILKVTEHVQLQEGQTDTAKG